MVDATFPVFEETNRTRVVTIVFDELPESTSKRNSHLFNNGTLLHLLLLKQMGSFSL